MGRVPQARTPTRLDFLDGVRGLAATYVVISHAWDTIYAYSHPMTPLQLGTSWMGAGRYAVTVFIVVSGFSLGLTYWRNGGKWPGGSHDFLWRRARRLLPPYWTAIAVSVLIGLTVLSQDQGTLWDGAVPIRWTGVVSHVLGIQDVYWAGPAGSTAFWSLAVELHIYLLFAIALLFIRRWTPPWIVVYVGLAGATVAAAIAPPSWLVTKISAMYPSLYAMFILGFLASRFAAADANDIPALLRQWSRRMTFAGAVGVATFTVCLPTFTPHSAVADFVLGPIAATLLVLLTVGRLRRLGRILSARLPTWLGHSSYSLYLIHPVFLELTWRFFVRPLHLAEAPRLTMELTLGMFLSVAAARMLYHTVERPFMSRRSRPEQPRPAQQPSAT